MAIIDETYFQQGELKLPIDAINDIQYYIDEHEKKILKDLLGYSLYKEFIDALAGTPAQKWIDLRDGTTYIDDNADTQEYEGIFLIIANYTYFNIVADKQSYVTGSGVKFGMTDNSESIHPRYKQKFAWNDMVDRIQFMDGFINASNDIDSTTYLNFDDSNTDVRSEVNVLNI
jgi:hypothetical protein